MKILIVGGSGGIGSSLVSSCLDYYPESDIIATYNTHPGDIHHSRLQWRKLDVTIEDDIENLSNDLGSIDLLINAVGFLHSESQKPEKTIKEFDPTFFQHNININTLPSILLAKHFMTSLRSNKTTHFVAFSAKIGSIEDNRMGGWLSYRVAKSALNMAMKTIAIEWSLKVPNCCVILFHSGTTDTQLSKPFQKNLPVGQLHSTNHTTDALLDIINSSAPADTGKFMSYNGSEIPW
ncbi:SDR family NAD(P)-dependent oxidoreductase [Methylophaga thiooxydans]|uniref:Oxidoreductase, short chain dehydrogenase/reductase family n=1 Tax=Methylophaga thiooxydans DMS010 TaxID=637616 RepID=C0N1Y8_9GAMM|nr:SDR family NAD(P)-dependent oxidoreductase [Methylophaga thiooxydans]EEF81131.1 oxidoreductase, short chain dehydrogenase/reductase family [Methylophaga thiooxydans DMS010]